MIYTARPKRAKPVIIAGGFSPQAIVMFFKYEMLWRSQ